MVPVRAEAVSCATRRRTSYRSSGTGPIVPAVIRGIRTARRGALRRPRTWWLEDLEYRDVWQARHGGYQVHHNSVVFAGTWTRTFTRMTSMEAACESARHAVNAILDHYVWVGSGGVDRRENTMLPWLFPYGFLDQGLSSPVRMPTPAGDYCYIFDVENREPLDTRPLRNLDTRFVQDSLPHPMDPPGEPPAAPTVPVPGFLGGEPMTSPTDYGQQLLTYLQAWRQYLEQATGAGMPMQPFPGAPSGMNTTLSVPAYMPPMVPSMPPMAPSSPWHRSFRPCRPQPQARPRQSRRLTTPSNCSPISRHGGNTSSRRRERRRRARRNRRIRSRRIRSRNRRRTRHRKKCRPTGTPARHHRLPGRRRL